MEFKRRELKFNIYGQEVKILAPTFSQLEEVQRDVENGENDVDRSIKLLESIGMPEGLAKQMEPDHLRALLEAISGSQKKK